METLNTKALALMPNETSVNTATLMLESRRGDSFCRGGATFSNSRGRVQNFPAASPRNLNCKNIRDRLPWFFKEVEVPKSKNVSIYEVLTHPSTPLRKSFKGVV